jgi:hypothetical protein
VVICTRFANREARSSIMMMAESLSRPSTYQDGTNFVLASVAIHSHTSPALTGADLAVGTFFCFA